MGHFKCLKKEVIVILCLTLSIRTRAQAEKLFCQDNRITIPGPPLPPSPNYFSTRVQVNYENNNQGVIIQKLDTTLKKESVEAWFSGKHRKYISDGNDGSFLTISYNIAESTCNRRLLANTNKALVYEDFAKALSRLQVIQEDVLKQTDRFMFKEPDTIGDIFGYRREFCDYVPGLDADLRVGLFYTEPSKGNQEKGKIIQIEVHGKVRKTNEEIIFTADFYNYQALPLDDKDFQIPESIHCPNYRVSKWPTEFANYFNFNTEIIQYSSTGVRAMSHSSVNYDFKAGLLRTDIQEQGGAKALQSVISDFNTGVQYTLDSILGTCSISILNVNFDVLSEQKTAPLMMLEPLKYFLMKDVSPSYNGKYETRGLFTEVFSSSVESGRKSAILFWYFVEGGTNEMDTKNLVKMVARPDSDILKRGQTEINFYNFVQEEPSSSVFDVSACYNESISKSFVFAFPGSYNMFLKESRISLKNSIQETIQRTAGVGRLRVVVENLVFREKYLFVEFMLLDFPPIMGTKPTLDESNLRDAISKLEKVVSEGSFQVSVRTNENLEIILKVEPGGLKEFQGERHFASQESTYKEGSVVGVAVGMTVLGILLGAVLVNLIISKKYGVSLFQNVRFFSSGAKGFNNSSKESSM